MLIMSNISNIKIERILPTQNSLLLTEKLSYIERDSFSPVESTKDSRMKFEFKPRIIAKINWLLFLLIICIVGYIFHLKGEVQDLVFEYRQITSQIDEEKKEQNILKAELAYLNSPTRLQKLAAEYLDLEHIQPKQFVAVSEDNKASVSKFSKLTKKKFASRWRYKKGITSIRTASGTKGGI
jgi:cell division protein FtsL